ncbi:MAG: hypothetical protein M1827_007262 [Pycnora praestabilis]|nr:MAG: hypothetical protein M1827_007262 [Pycnora praestabilis]
MTLENVLFLTLLALVFSLSRAYAGLITKRDQYCNYTPYGAPNPSDCEIAFGLMQQDFDQMLTPHNVRLNHAEAVSDQSVYWEWLGRGATPVHASESLAGIVQMPKTYIRGYCIITVRQCEDLPSSDIDRMDIILQIAKDIVLECVIGSGIGGDGIAGVNNEIGIYVYGPRSRFPYRVRDWMNCVSCLSATCDVTIKPFEQCSADNLDPNSFISPDSTAYRTGMKRPRPEAGAPGALCMEKDGCAFGLSCIADSISLSRMYKMYGTNLLNSPGQCG